MFVLAIDHGAVGHGFSERAEEHLDCLGGSGVRLPRTRPSATPGTLALRADVVAALHRSEQCRESPDTGSRIAEH